MTTTTRITDKQRERRARDLAWRRDLALEAGLWTSAAVYEQRLAATLRPGERLVGRRLMYSAGWL